MERSARCQFEHGRHVLFLKRSGKTLHRALARMCADRRQLLGEEISTGIERLDGIGAGRELSESGAVVQIGLDQIAGGAARHEAGGAHRQHRYCNFLAGSVKGAYVSERELLTAFVRARNDVAFHLRLLSTPRGRYRDSSVWSSL